jgi:hypothetical protein
LIKDSNRLRAKALSDLDAQTTALKPWFTDEIRVRALALNLFLPD